MKEIISLLKPKTTGEKSLGECIFRRCSIRKFLRQELTLGQISQILWSAQGITGSGISEFRAAPSAGALYPYGIVCITS